MHASESKPKILVAIPARGGSKGVPRKNLRLLGGVPLIGWSIRTGLESRHKPRVVVTTDDREIAEVARKLGAEVPFLRPAELAADDTPTLPVIQHLLECLEQAEGYTADILVLLQPTSPLRSVASLDSGVELLLGSTADSVLGVCKSEHPPQWLKVLGPDGYLVDFVPGGSAIFRRQDSPTVYRINGALYVTRPGLVRQQKRLLGDRVLPLIMPQEESLDIDTELDLCVAEAILRHCEEPRQCD